MSPPTRPLFVAVSSNHPDQLQRRLEEIGAQDLEDIGLEDRLRLLTLAIMRDNPKHLELLDQWGWLDGHIGSLHPLVLAAVKRKTRSVGWLLGHRNTTNTDIVRALAESLQKTRTGRCDPRRETIHQLLLDQIERQANEESPWPLALANLLDGPAGWRGADKARITPRLFSDRQHEQFLDLWPRSNQKQQAPDQKTSLWLLEQGLDPERAAEKAPFWKLLAAPFLARLQATRLDLATDPATGSSRKGERL